MDYTYREFARQCSNTRIEPCRCDNRSAEEREYERRHRDHDCYDHDDSHHCCCRRERN